MEAVTPHPPPPGELDPLFGSLPKESIFALIEEFERESKEAIPGPVSRLVETSVALEREYRDWQESKRLRLKYPPPVGEFSLSQVRLFLSPRFKLVSSLPPNAVKLIIRSYDSYRPMTVRSLELLEGEEDAVEQSEVFGILSLDHIVMLYRVNHTWHIASIVSQYEDSDWYQIIASPWDSVENYQSIKLQGTNGTELIDKTKETISPDATLIYGMMHKTPLGDRFATVDELEHNVDSVTDLYEASGSFWGKQSYADRITSGLRPPSKRMLSHSGQLVIITGVLDKLIDSKRLTIVYNFKTSAFSRSILLTYEVPDSDNVTTIRHMIKEIDETMRGNTTSNRVSWSEPYKGAVNLRRETEFASLSISISILNQDGLYDTNKIGKDLTLKRLTDNYSVKWLQNPFFLFNPSTEWGKKWNYNGSFYLSGQENAENTNGGIMIMPFPWFMVLLDYSTTGVRDEDGDVSPHLIVLESTAFVFSNRDISVYRFSTRDIPTRDILTGDISSHRFYATTPMVYQPSEFLYLRNYVSIEDLEKLAMVQKPTIRTRAEARIISL